MFQHKTNLILTAIVTAVWTAFYAVSDPSQVSTLSVATWVLGGLIGGYGFDLVAFLWTRSKV